MNAALRTKRRPKAPSVTGSASASERDVIIHLGDVGRRLFGSPRRPAALARAAFAWRGARRCFVAAVVPAATSATAIARSEELHVLGDDLGRVFLDTLFIGPLARFQPALNIDRAALAQVFAGDLRQASEKHDAAPLGFFDLLAARVLVLARGGDRYIGDRGAIRAVARFWIAPEIADKDYLVDRGHGLSEVELFASGVRLGACDSALPG